MNKKNQIVLILCLLNLYAFTISAQVVERETPREWDNLVEGARFMDRFLPMKGSVLSSDTWGAKEVLPRYVDNGIEDRIWSYWGGNIKNGADDLYHMLVCGWLEASEKGHMEWPNSYVFNAVSENLEGPYNLRNLIGKGHNPEVYQLEDGRYVLYVIGGRYISDDLNGNWEFGEFDFDARDRRIVEGLSNLSFVQREDGSYMMVCRGGGIWVSKDGLDTFYQLTDKSVYPAVEGRFEDPVIWKDHIQYHMIVNDWLGRIAYYLRSKDGVNWVVDPGEAYTPDIAVHEDGYKENWFKFERIKMYQDDYGRPIQANFAVIDTIKWDDKPFDTHSSKNITIPLNPGVLLEILNDKPISPKTRTISLKIRAEEGFDPQFDMDIQSLRFGASKEVNFGRGSKVIDVESSGSDLILTFNAKDAGIDEDEFAPKLIGKYSNGRVLYGYARIPETEYITPILSARAPVFEQKGRSWECMVTVENFGLVDSDRNTYIKVEALDGSKRVRLCDVKLPVLGAYDNKELNLKIKRVDLNKLSDSDITTTIYTKKEILSEFTHSAKFKEK